MPTCYLNFLDTNISNFKKLTIYAAPLQGYTESIYRHAHSIIYGSGPDVWFTPFIRVERGEPRNRDMRELSSQLNANHNLIPQIIFRNAAEWEALVNAIISLTGFRHIDMNLGCPFVPQMRKGRGAGFLKQADELRIIADKISGMPHITFSIKMRPGIKESTEWESLASVINSMPLSHVTIHPRVAAQQYDGAPDLAVIDRASDLLTHPIVYNGDINTPADIDTILSRFPHVSGVMTGRGMLARPSLVTEWNTGREWDSVEQLEFLLRLHDMIAKHYETTLSGESQILSKLKPFWDYPADIIGRRAAKAIKKSATMRSYRQAIAAIDGR